MQSSVPASSPGTGSTPPLAWGERQGWGGGPGRRGAGRRSVPPLLAAACLLTGVALAAVGYWQHHYLRGLELENQGNWAEAQVEFLRAIEAQPRPRSRVVTAERTVILRYDPHFHRARCLVELGRFREAAVHLQLARAAGVTPPPAIRELADRIQAHWPPATPTTSPPPTPIPTTPPTPTPLPTATTPLTPVASPQAEPLPTPTPGAAPTPVVTPLQFQSRPAPLHLWAAAALVAAPALAAWWLWRRQRGDGREAGKTAATQHLETAITAIGTEGVLGGYRLTGILGRGGMGTTYRAVRERDGTAAAVKVPHEGWRADASFLARFLREGKLGEQLHHPRIVRIFEAGEEGGQPFLAMELLQGKTLKQLLREEAPLALRRALEMARDIAEALDYAHAKGVVHRDLKPENIMVMGDGVLKVMDFGIARVAGEAGLTASHSFLGTPLYAAPEMVEAKRIDHRADLYALGIILFEMLEGTVPFTADSPYRVLKMHVEEPLPSGSALPRPVPPAVWQVVERLSAKDPNDRYPTAAALLVELNRLLQHFPRLEGERG
jgi:tetratricopeptide (TPR) repeat protein